MSYHALSRALVLSRREQQPKASYMHTEVPDCASIQPTHLFTPRSGAWTPVGKASNYAPNRPRSRAYAPDLVPWAKIVVQFCNIRPQSASSCSWLQSTRNTGNHLDVTRSLASGHGRPRLHHSEEREMLWKSQITACLASSGDMKHHRAFCA
jgi:hypothetical protein